MKGFAVIYLEVFAFILNRNNFHLSVFFREYDFRDQEAMKLKDVLSSPIINVFSLSNISWRKITEKRIYILK